MPFSRPTLQELIVRIEADIEARLTGGVALLRRALLRVLARVFAGAIHIAYGYVSFIAEQLFVSTAERTWLDRHGFIWGVTRKAAAFATGTIKFYGVDGTLVESGVRVQTDTGIEYETTGAGNIAGGYTTLPATALEPGGAGNIVVGTVVELIEPISGVTSVEVASDFGGGVDDETDNDYRQRILNRIQEPPAGGTAADYVRWAEEVTGVQKAWCFPVTPGPGQVTVAYRGSALEATVEAYISALMPVTADLFVEKVVEKPIDFSIAIRPLTTEFSAAIELNLEQLFAEQAAPGGTILRSQIDNAISSSGVTDFVMLAYSGAPVDVYGNLLFTGYEYGIVNVVNISAM